MDRMPERVRIASPQNDRVKELVRLRARRHRERTGSFPVEGAREATRALDAGVTLQEAFLCPDLFNAQATAVAKRLEGGGVPIVELGEDAFRKASLRESPDGVLVVAEAWTVDLATLELPGEPLVLVVDGLEKPGNVGALLRTADAAGVTAVFLSGAGTDLYNPNVIRASMGSVFARPVVPAEAEDLAAFFHARNIRVVAAAPHASRVYWEADLSGPTAIVVGSEHRGLESDWLDRAELRVRIPMGGLADSLNVATAGALLLYEALRQRRPVA